MTVHQLLTTEKNESDHLLLNSNINNKFRWFLRDVFNEYVFEMNQRYQIIKSFLISKFENRVCLSVFKTNYQL